VSRLQTAGNLCREVFEQIKGELKNPLENYSLYWPEQKQWLPLNKQIGLVHLRSGAVLEFKAKKRCLRIRFLDASSKLVRVDETLTVSTAREQHDIVIPICKSHYLVLCIEQTSLLRIESVLSKC